MAGLYDDGILSSYDVPNYGYQDPSTGVTYQQQMQQQQNQMQPQQQQQMVNPQNMAWGAALQNIGNIIGGRAPSQNISSAYMQGKMYNDKLRSNKASMERQARDDERQAKQDEIMGRYRESQIVKNMGAGGVDEPMNVKEYEYFKKLPKDGKEDFLTMKRADRFYQQGDVQMRAPQLGGAAQAVAPEGILAPDGSAPNQPQMQAIADQQAAQTAATVSAAQNAQKVSQGYFERLQPINEGIGRLDRAIELIDSGADTGPIAQYFPSFSAASQELDNLQSQLGLDVVGQTTFGALSAGELKMALDVAVPANMNEEDLKVWLTDKRQAQTKLKNYLESAAMYLSQPGNTQAGWVSEQKSRQESAKSGDKSSRLAELRAKHGS